MKKKYFSLALSLIIVLGLTFNFASAQVILVENFDTPANTELTSMGWTAHSGGTTAPIAVTTPGLTLSGYVCSGIGGAAKVSNNGQDVNKKFPEQTDGVVYASFLLKLGNTNSSGYFLHFGQTTIGSTFFTRVFVNATGDSIAFGLSTPSSARVFVGKDTTKLVVIKIDFSSKTSYMYVFDETPTSEPTTPNSLFVETASFTNIGSIALRQYNAAQRVIVDGIRVAKTWNDLFSDNAPTATFNPINNEENVALNIKPKITFNEAVRNIDNSEITDPASLITFKKTDENGVAVPFTATIDTDKKVFEITPNSALEGNQVYYFAIAPIENIADVATSTLSAKFTTKIVDNVPPLADTAFASNYSTIKVVFNEAVEKVSAENTSNYTGLNIASATLNSNLDTVTIALNTPLIDNITANICIQNINDTTGNAMAAQKCFDVLYTTLDLVPPTVLKAWARDLSTVKVVYSEAMEKTSAETIANYTGLESIGAALLNANLDTITLTLSTPLISDIKDTLYIANVKDVTGNAMATEQQFEIKYTIVIEKKLIAAWHFDSLLATPNTLLVIPSDSGLQKDVATIYADGTNGSSSFVNATDGVEITAFGGTILADERTNPRNSMALSIVNQTANNKGIVLKYNSKNYIDAEIIFATRGTASGFKKHIYSYSTDAINFTKIDSIDANITNTWKIESINLSSIIELQHAENVYIRIAFTDATTASGNNRIDNISIKAVESEYIDNVPPIAVSASLNNLQTIVVNFNENVEINTAETVSNYSGVGTISSASLTDGKKVTLLLENPLNNAQTYTLKVANIKDIVGNLMTETYSFDLKLDTITGLNENIAYLIKLYPNPANSYITMENANEITQIAIYNNIGVLIKEEYFNSKSGKIILKLDDLNNGLYFINAKTLNGDNINKSFIVIK